MPVDPVEYYSRRRVAEEVAAFLKGRWAAVEGKGRRWVRWSQGAPLAVRGPGDVPAIVRAYRSIGARSFYGTIEVFKRLSSRSDVEEGYEGNVEAVTPFIDIDLVDEGLLEEKWRYCVEAARLITGWLCSEWGVCESVYLLWSGAGIHVRINEKAFTWSELGAHPLDAAFAVAEYTLSRLETSLYKVIVESGGAVKIENLVAPKRVFTAPLSLHRRLDRAAVAMTPRELDDFTLDWSSPENPRHNPNAWRSWRRGEADSLAREALRRVGRVKKHTLMEARATRLTLPQAATPTQRRETSGAPREPGRFQVMALLQAARYYLLEGDVEKAKSWGLNRAIFYAWAKYYGPARRPRRPARIIGRRLSRGAAEEAGWVVVGGEKAQVSPNGWFMMGGVEQRPEDFDRYVARRFEEAGIDFKEAWKAAIEYLKRFPKTVLQDPQRFYKEVYEPVRDRFVEKVLKRKKTGAGTMGLDKWLGKR